MCTLRQLQRFFFLMPILVILLSCVRKQTPTTEARTTDLLSYSLYSDSVQDSFQVLIQYPLEYAQDTSVAYPTVIVTDADFYFGMLAPIVRQYEIAGLLPPLVLIGVGYGSLAKMDSVRVRDFMYPASIASDEMDAQGGGLRYYHFLADELLPHLKASGVRSDARFLLGHSFGGYFSLLGMLEQIKNKRDDFDGFVAASPSLWYNDFYLPKHVATYNSSGDSLRLFLSVGDMENKEWGIDPLKSFAGALTDSMSSPLDVKTRIYPGTDHMDAGLFSFVLGLREMIQE